MCRVNLLDEAVDFWDAMFMEMEDSLLPALTEFSLTRPISIEGVRVDEVVCDVDGDTITFSGSPADNGLDPVTLKASLSEGTMITGSMQSFRLMVQVAWVALPTSAERRSAGLDRLPNELLPSEEHGRRHITIPLQKPWPLAGLNEVPYAETVTELNREPTLLPPHVDPESVSFMARSAVHSVLSWMTRGRIKPPASVKALTFKRYRGHVGLELDVGRDRPVVINLRSPQVYLDGQGGDVPSPSANLLQLVARACRTFLDEPGLDRWRELIDPHQDLGPLATYA